MTGTPRDKALFVTLPADAVLSVPEAMTSPDVVQALAYLQAQTADAEFSAAAADLVKAAVLQLKQNHRRVIGVALSSATQGELFDILFRGGGAF